MKVTRTILHCLMLSAVVGCAYVLEENAHCGVMKVLSPAIPTTRDA